MKKTSIQISIPTPCHESWDRMDATAQGAFCHSCAKEVIDFSAMTDREVIAYLQNHKTGCGKFRSDQLDTKLTIPEVDNGIFKWKALMLGILPLFSFKNLMTMPRIGAPTDQGLISKTEKRDTVVKMQSDTIERPRKMGLADVRNYIEDTIQLPTQVNLDTTLLRMGQVDAGGSITINGSRPDEVQYLISGNIQTSKPQRIRYWFRRTFRSRHKR